MTHRRSDCGILTAPSQEVVPLVRSVLVLQTVVPCVLLLWLWWSRPWSRADGALRVTLVLGVIAALGLATPWLSLPPFVCSLWLVVWPFAAVRAWRRMVATDAAGWRLWWRRAVVALLAGGVAAAWTTAALAVDGRRVPVGHVLDLACPLGPGAYRVVNGGSRLFVNAHLATLEPAPRVAPWRGQSYGLDLVQIDGFGRRARRLLSPNVSDYFIYGQSVLAPCDGRVVAAVDGRPDMTVGARDPDREHLAGNYVRLACGAYDVLLAHLQPGSVRVDAGDAVSTGTLLGFVGNSGNTDEPHLHISAQRRAGDEPPIGGQPVWITIEGRFGIRNDRVGCD